MERADSEQHFRYPKSIETGNGVVQNTKQSNLGDLYNHTMKQCFFPALILILVGNKF